MQLQLELFEPLSIETANELLKLLNDGRKKDLLVPESAVQYCGFVILSAKNKEYGTVFNMVDMNGKIPDGSSVNWRNLKMVFQDLVEQLETTKILKLKSCK